MIEQTERQALRRGVEQRDFDYLVGVRDGLERALGVPQVILREQMEA